MVWSRGRRRGVLRLCSVIPEIAKGNFCKAYLQSWENNGTLHMRLDENEKRGNGHPAIYVCPCVDNEGESMLLSDAAKVARYMLRYISEKSEILRRMARHSCEIDRMFLDDDEKDE